MNTLRVFEVLIANANEIVILNSLERFHNSEIHSRKIIICFLLLLCYHSPLFQTLTALTMPRHLRSAGIASCFLIFSFFGV
jgi:hypothetical protein